jgi:hypothetical protein
MFDPAAHLEAAVKARARKGARRAGLLLVSGLLLAIGMGFVSVAIWIVTAAAWSPLVAALLLGAIHLGAGGIVLYLALPSHEPAGSPSEAQPSGETAPFPPLAEAFVFGLDTALRLRRARDE